MILCLEFDLFKELEIKKSAEAHLITHRIHHIIAGASAKLYVTLLFVLRRHESPYSSSQLPFLYTGEIKLRIAKVYKLR